MPSPPAIGGRLALVRRCVGRRRFLFVGGREFVALEVEVEALVEQVLLVRRLGEDQGEGILQHGAVGEADDIDGAGGIDPLGRGYAQSGAAGHLQEAAERFAGRGGLYSVVCMGVARVTSPTKN